MEEQSRINKQAWEYRAYEFWVKRDGAPAEYATSIKADPAAMLKKHRHYFEDVAGKAIANICGSNGRKAVPLALVGADVTVFDISEENARYALELAHYAETKIEYIIGDIYAIDLTRYSDRFDILYLEGGILHYFADLKRFLQILFAILKPGGQLILSDFHPVGRWIDADLTYRPRYFDQALHASDLAYKSHFTDQEQADFPDVAVRYFTLSEILNGVIATHFTLQQFEEHRGWNGENIPGEFTLLATKSREGRNG
ncbi:class I SAM-dependent methyltransferase [Exiguobacterium sp. TDN 0502]|uniref:class I SAM-dependent methyltransferase n=1 Tax=Exiguobacterium sp. TDN 0502 TaxID=3420731 RepID=UPI003D76F4A7